MHVDRKVSEKQTSEDKIGFVIIRKKGQYPVHQVRGFLVPRERERNKRGYKILQSMGYRKCTKGTYCTLTEGDPYKDRV